MHIIKNKRGNEVIYQSPSLKSCWGYIDDKGDYIIERSASKGQIFHFFDNAVAIQLEVLDFLERKYVGRDIRCYISDFEKEKFWLICAVKNFRKFAFRWQDESGKPAIVNYDKKDYKKYGKQIRLPMNSWIRDYANQQKLI